MQLYEELRRIVASLDQKGIACALVGGLAYSLHVEPRNTEDIDLLVLESDVESIRQIMKELGFLPHDSTMTFKKTTILRCIRIEKGDLLMVDFLIARPEQVEMIARAVRTDLEAQPLRVVGITDLIELKRMRLSDQDRLDIRRLEEKLHEGS